MNKYTINCTEEQTKKALELGAPIESQEYCPVGGLDNDWFAEGRLCFRKPTAEQMIGWLEEQGFFVIIHRIINADKTFTYYYYIYDNNNEEISDGIWLFDTNSEATLAAIDAALEYLTNK